jgi:Glucodextranase, domain B/PASTA domain
MRFAIVAIAVAALAIAPAAARATVTSSTITSWVSSQPGTPANDPYLVSYDNSTTTLTVKGTATGTGNVDIACFEGSSSSFGTFATNVPVTGGRFNTGAHALRTAVPSTTLAGHACRLRAIPAGSEGPGTDSAAFAGPQVAVSEVAFTAGATLGSISNFVVQGTTFTGSAGWSAAGGCGPDAAPLDQSLDSGNFAINCMGSLLAGNLLKLPTRSEVLIDGRDAYDAAAAAPLFTGSFGLQGFPALSTSVAWDPSTGLVSSQSTEAWVVCASPEAYPATSTNCLSFAPAGVQLERYVAMSDGGRVVTMTDVWSSTDDAPHAVDLLYDDYVGLNTSSAQRGYEFPGQSSFTAYGSGQTLPGANAAPGSIFVRTNIGAPDGDVGEAVGAITFSSAPTGFVFAGNNELEEHQVLDVPAAGSTRLTYIYSTGYSLAEVQTLALAAQDRIQSPAVAITSPANGTTVSTPTATVAGLAGAGSGISSLIVGGQPAAVGRGGAWSAQVPLSLGPNTITAVATDGAGATAQAQVAIDYRPATPSPIPAPTPCTVPRTKGLKLPAAENAIRRAHCRVGKIKKEHSRKVRQGRVVDTNPVPGRKLPAGRRVELFVSKGR